MTLKPWNELITYHDEPYKMRWYIVGGENDGNLACETYHTSISEMCDIQLAMNYAGIDFMHRPTMWEKIPGGWEINDFC